MDAEAWDERYREQPMLWGTGPNVTVERVLADTPAGRGVDLACGDGRNASWLATQGWRMVGVDYSAEAIGQARQRPTDPGSVEWVVDDVTRWTPNEPLDLVLVAYLHIAPDDFGPVLRRAGGWLAPGGQLLYVGHARENIGYGVGGPQDPSLLLDVPTLAGLLDGLRVETVGHLTRDTDHGAAVDIIGHARRWPH